MTAAASSRDHGSRPAWAIALCAAVVVLGFVLAVAADPRRPGALAAAAALCLAAAPALAVVVGRRTRSSEARAAAGEALRTAIVDSALDCIVTADARGRVIGFNPAAERVFGYSREEALGEEMARLIIPPGLRDQHRAGLARLVATGEARIVNQRLEIVAMRRGGEEFPAELAVTRLPGTEPPVFTGHVRDLTDRRRAERQARAQHDVARALAGSASSHEAIQEVLAALANAMEWDLGAAWLVEGDVLRCDALWQQPGVEAGAFRALTRRLTPARGAGPLGRAWAAGVPSSLEDVTALADDPRGAAAVAAGLGAGLWVPLRSGDEVLGVLEFYARLGNPLTEDLLRVLAGAGAQIGEYLRRRRAEEQLAHQALHDTLTGLPNRALLNDRVEHALAVGRRDGRDVAVLFIDLDDFKLVNDTLGHSAGDDLLRTVAARLQEVSRASDMLARLGGDEFVLLCEDVDRDGEAAAQVAERVVQALAAPVVLAGRELVMTASVGVAVAPAGQATAETLLRDADAAMYRAKECGRGRYELFDEALRTRVVSRLELQSELRLALERGELRLHYQPIVSTADGSVRGVEALVRWAHPERGLLAPGAFIPVAEPTPLIGAIGAWVLGTACRQAAEWEGRLGMSVNLSPRQLGDPRLVDAVAATLEATGMPAAALTLEITEGVLIQDDRAALDLLAGLRALGVRLALDDFGTGYSSLSYLNRLPLDVLKLDRSFVAGDAQAPIVAAVVAMARALDIAVLAEGVETDAQWAALRAVGCPLAQGYRFSPPLPAEELAAFLSAPVAP